MSKGIAGGLLAVSIAFIACSEFNGDASAPTPSEDGGIDAGAAEASGAVGISFKFAAGPLYLIQTRDTDVAFEIERQPGSTGPVVVTVSNLPKDASAAPVTIPAGETKGKVVITVAASTPQGPAALDFAALESGPNGASTKTIRSAYVRGLPGTLDTTFGTMGIQTAIYTKTSHTGTISDAAVSEDDSIFITGKREGAGAVKSIAVTKLKSTGAAFDTTFAASGIYVTGGALVESAVALHDPSSALKGVVDVMSGSPQTITLHRLDASGIPVSTFNGGNKVDAVVPNHSMASGQQIVSLPDGDILLLAYYATPGAFAVSRWKANGTLAIYGSSGACRIDATGTGMALGTTARMIPRADGSVVVLFSLGSGYAIKVCTASGNIDTLIGTPPNHFVVAGSGSVTSVSPTATGGFVVLSTKADTFTQWRRFDANLAADTTIGASGDVATPGPGAAAILASGDGVLTGRGQIEFFRIVRQKSDGSTDTAFGNQGTLSISVAGVNAATLVKLVAQTDGRIVAAGSSESSFDGALARFWP
jgi:hypothetical protein